MTHPLSLRLLSIFAFMAMLVPAPSEAAVADPNEWDPFIGEVFVSPLIYVGTDQPDLALSVRENVRAGANEYVRHMSGVFRAVELEDLQSQIRSRPTYEDSVGIGREWRELGLEYYKRLETGDAIANLLKSESTYRKLYYEYVNPREYAEVLQYLALSHLEQKSALANTLDYMKLMMKLDPTRRFREGYYPRDVVSAFQSARMTLERDFRNNGPEVSRARKLAELTGAEFIVIPGVVPADDRHELIIYVYSSREETFLPPESHSLPTLTAPGARAAANRLMSRLATCLIEPRPDSVGRVVESTGESPWSVELNFAYASFFDFPDSRVELFGNYGASFGAAYLLTREFSFLSNVQLLTSLRDRSGFLPEGFTTLRGFAGIGLGYTFGFVRPEVASLLEVSRIGDIAVCDNINGVNDFCPTSRTDYEVNTLLGINVRPRVKMQIFKSLVYALGGSATFYVFPFSGQTVNFPLTLETGLEYRF